MNSSKTRCIGILILVCILLVLLCGITIVIDPFFHYHAPIAGLQYPIRNQRYQNYGIVKHFEYDAVLTGTSMTENFKASEFDTLFGVQSVKVPINGSSFKEVNDLLLCAVEHNPDIRIVVRGIDSWNLFDDKDHMRTDAAYPTYLYDENIFNDVQYLLNKDILCNYTLDVLKHTIKGNRTTSFDEYSSWDTSRSGMEHVRSNYQRPDAGTENAPLTAQEAETLRQTVEQNLISIARAHPDIQFYYFFTPYSIFYMDYNNQYGILQRELEGCRLATEMLLECDNIRVFSFFDDYDLITDPDNYSDKTHYTAAINSLLLQRMQAGDYELTKDNYQQHWSDVSAFYLAYDYDALFTES